MLKGKSPALVLTRAVCTYARYGMRSPLKEAKKHLKMEMEVKMRYRQVWRFLLEDGIGSQSYANVLKLCVNCTSYLQIHTYISCLVSVSLLIFYMELNVGKLIFPPFQFM